MYTDVPQLHKTKQINTEQQIRKQKTPPGRGPSRPVRPRPPKGSQWSDASSPRGCVWPRSGGVRRSARIPCGLVALRTNLTSALARSRWFPLIIADTRDSDTVDGKNIGASEPPSGGRFLFFWGGLVLFCVFWCLLVFFVIVAARP